MLNSISIKLAFQNVKHLTSAIWQVPDELEVEQHSPISKFRYMFLIVSGRYSFFTHTGRQNKLKQSCARQGKSQKWDAENKIKGQWEGGLAAGGSLWSHPCYTAQTWSSLLAWCLFVQDPTWQTWSLVQKMLQPQKPANHRTSAQYFELKEP